MTGCYLTSLSSHVLFFFHRPFFLPFVNCIRHLWLLLTLNICVAQCWHVYVLRRYQRYYYCQSFGVRRGLDGGYRRGVGWGAYGGSKTAWDGETCSLLGLLPRQQPRGRRWDYLRKLLPVVPRVPTLHHHRHSTHLTDYHYVQFWGLCQRNRLVMVVLIMGKSDVLSDYITCAFLW